jgi:hypothetical protein
MSILSPRRSTLRHAAALCVSALAAIAHAQSTAVIPPAAETAAGVVSDAMPLGQNSQGVYQAMYDATLVTAIPLGSVVTGLQIRQAGFNLPAFPSDPVTLDRYDITMASSNLTPGTMSGTFASNLRNPVLVRSGAYSIPAGAYPGGPSSSTPKGWGPLISFTTGFVYSGGPLVIEFRLRRSGPILGIAAADIVPAPGQAAEATTFSSDNALSTGVQFAGSALAVRLTFTPPPVDLAKGVTKVTVGDAFVASEASSGTTTPFRAAPRTMVSAVHENQFDTIGPGSEFVGLAYRSDGSVVDPWPMAAANFTTYDLQLSRSVNVPGSVSPTVADNVGADAVVTRSGPLSIPIGSFAPRNTQSTAPFSWEIAFNTSYSYRGGPLLTVLRHTGLASGVDAAIDGELNADAGNGTLFGTAVALDSSANVTTAGTAFPITRYSVDAGTSSPLNQLAPAPGGFGTSVTQRLQIVLSASELRFIPVGSVIDSLWLRQVAAALVPAPATDASALDFEISLSTAANPPESMSATFADNQGSDLVVVHDGPLSIPAGAMPPGNKGTFGKIAQFRRQFVYKGGPLCIDIRHSGLSEIINSLDAVQNTQSTNRIISSNNPDAVVGNFFGGTYSGIAVKLGYTPSVISPNNLATGVSFDPWVLSRIPNYTVQFIVPASQLRSMDAGSAITGLSLRRATELSTSTAAFPPSDVTVPRFDVSISTALNPPALMSNVFGENVDMDNVLVRSGPLTVPANAFPASGIAGAPNDNAWYISFDRGYVYSGADLCVTIRGQGVIDPAGLFEGSEGAPAQIGNAMYNYIDDNATSGFSYTPLALRFAFTPRAFCPADLNNDGIVEDADFQIFVVAYDILDCADGSMPAGCPSDLNYDGVVNDDDFQAFVLAYNELLCP